MGAEREQTLDFRLLVCGVEVEMHPAEFAEPWPAMLGDSVERNVRARSGRVGEDDPATVWRLARDVAERCPPEGEQLVEAVADRRVDRLDILKTLSPVESLRDWREDLERESAAMSHAARQRLFDEWFATASEGVALRGRRCACHTRWAGDDHPVPVTRPGGLRLERLSHHLPLVQRSARTPDRTATHRATLGGDAGDSSVTARRALEVVERLDAPRGMTDRLDTKGGCPVSMQRLELRDHGDLRLPGLGTRRLEPGTGRIAATGPERHRPIGGSGGPPCAPTPAALPPEGAPQCWGVRSSRALDRPNGWLAVADGATLATESR